METRDILEIRVVVSEVLNLIFNIPLTHSLFIGSYPICLSWQENSGVVHIRSYLYPSILVSNLIYPSMCLLLGANAVHWRKRDRMVKQLMGLYLLDIHRGKISYSETTECTYKRINFS